MRQSRMTAPFSNLKSPRSPNLSSELCQDSPCAIAQATVERNTNAASFMRTFLSQRTSTVNLMRPGIRDSSLLVPEVARLVFTQVNTTTLHPINVPPVQ